MVEIRLRKENVVCEFQLDLSDIKLPNDFETLQDLEKEVENSIFHLKKSNEEIKKFDPDGKDTDLLLALNENIFALSKKERRLEMIREKMKTLGTEQKIATVLVHPSSTLLNTGKTLNEREKQKVQKNITEIENISSYSKLSSELHSESPSETVSDFEKEVKSNIEESENDSVKKKIITSVKRKTENCDIGDESDNLKSDCDDNVSLELEKRKKSVSTSDSATEDGLFL